MPTRPKRTQAAPAAPPMSRPVAVSDELRAPVSTDIELCYQTFGDAADEPTDQPEVPAAH